jgi:hypothetical protein
MFFSVPGMVRALRTDEIHDQRFSAAINFGDFCLVCFEVNCEIACSKAGESESISSIGKRQRELQFN